MMSVFRLPLRADSFNIYDADDGELVIHYDYEDFNGLTADQAAEIVEAVNSHAALLESARVLWNIVQHAKEHIAPDELQRIEIVRGDLEKAGVKI